MSEKTEDIYCPRKLFRFDEEKKINRAVFVYCAKEKRNTAYSCYTKKKFLRNNISDGGKLHYTVDVLHTPTS